MTRLSRNGFAPWFLALLVLGLSLSAPGCRRASPPDVAGDTGPGPGQTPTDPPSGAGQPTATVQRSIEGLRPELAQGYALAFAAPNPGKNAPETIYVSVPWTADPVVLDTETNGQFAWHPDGRRLLYLRQPGGSEAPFTLLLSPLDGSEATPLATYQGWPYYALHTPGFSPDGSFITLEDGTSVACVLHILSTLGEELHAVGVYGGYVWSPDCSRLAYEGQEDLDPPIPVGDGCSGSLRVLDPLTGEDVLLVKGDRDYMYGPVAWPAESQLIYSRYTIGKAPDWKPRTDYFSLDPTDPAAVPVLAPRPEGLPPAHDDQRALIPAELREAWTGFFVGSPDGSAALFATHLDTYPYYTLRILDLQTGAHGVIGAGGVAGWSPASVEGP